jgi:hypothetical protein
MSLLLAAGLFAAAVFGVAAARVCFWLMRRRKAAPNAKPKRRAF